MFVGYFTLGVETFGAYTTLFLYKVMIMRDFIAYLIQVIHILIRIFIVATPFVGGEYLLTIHLLTIPFIMMHWLTNQTVCALTELEKIVRGGCLDTETFFGQIMIPIYKNESFVGRIISPFYEIKDKDTEKKAVWAGLTCLWLITFMRLKKTGFSQLREDISSIRRAFPF